MQMYTLWITPGITFMDRTPS